MKKLFAILLCIAALTPAGAQSTRYYGAADFGTISMRGADAYSSPESLSVSGGYRYLNNLSFEAGYTVVGSTTANVASTGKVSVNQTIVSAVAVGVLPIDRQFSLSAKIGLGLHNFEITGLTEDLVMGLGGAYQINSRLSARVQYERLGKAKIPYATEKAEMTRLAVGISASF